MVTSCAVIGCTQRHAKGVKIGFYRFPRDGEKRRLWITALQRKNTDGSDWIPGEGDRVCGDHFTTGTPQNNSTHLEYVPSVAMGYNNPHVAGQSQSLQSLGRFDQAQQRRETRISLAAEAAEEAEQAQLLLHVQQKRVRQKHCYATCNSEPESAAKHLQPASYQLLQAGGKNGQIPTQVEVNTDWTIPP